MSAPTNAWARTNEPAKRPPGALLAAIALLACVGAAGAVLLRIHNDTGSAPGLQVALLDWIILSYVGAGLVAWRQRPESRLGPLMIFGGLTTMFACLSSTAEEPYFTIGQALDLFPFAVFLHVYLAFPTGRLRGAREVALVATTYTVAIGMELLVLALSGFKPDNAIALLDEPDLAADIFQIELILMAVLALAGLAVLTLRRPIARPMRPPVGWLLRVFSLALLMAGLTLLLAAFDTGSSLFLTMQRASFFVIGLAPFVFLYALLDARLARASVGDLLVELRAEPPPSDLDGPLARALHDPSVTLAYWLPEYGRWADQEGSPVVLPADDDELRSVTVIDRDGEHVAALVHDPSLDDERDLLEAVSAAAAIALENARLHAELKAKLKELEGSRERVLEASQQERKRLERNLHDGAQQRLIALSLELGMLEDKLGDDAAAREQIQTARDQIAVSLEELRAVARGLHPAVLSGHGLAVALKSLTASAPVPVQLDVTVDERLEESIEVAAYYVVNECLANIGKHARAQLARVSVGRSDGRLFVEVADDGIGGADTAGGSGLRGLTDRVEALGGSLRVWTPSGGGTTVRAEMPCA
jgi:signal transduction histidine kinase